METNVISDVFGTKVFNDEVMQEYLPKKTYQSLKNTMESGEELTPEVANVVAHGMKEWALANGATHYTHWYQPMTGVTAEKQDSFLGADSESHAVLEFNGKELVKGEPDASSFPSGDVHTEVSRKGRGSAAEAGIQDAMRYEKKESFRLRLFPCGQPFPGY